MQRYCPVTVISSSVKSDDRRPVEAHSASSYEKGDSHMSVATPPPLRTIGGEPDRSLTLDGAPLGLDDATELMKKPQRMFYQAPQGDLVLVESWTVPKMAQGIDHGQ